VALLKNNSIETCTLDVTQRKPEAVLASQLLMPGHRTEPRTVAFSSDNTAILSASSDSLRVWNRYISFTAFRVCLVVRALYNWV